jgi:hypothetical protein
MKPYEGKHETPKAASNEKVDREYLKLHAAHRDISP